MLWVFGAGGAALAAMWLGRRIDAWRGRGDERWANRLAVAAMVSLGLLFVVGWATSDHNAFTQVDVEPDYRADHGSGY